MSCNIIDKNLIIKKKMENFMIINNRRSKKALGMIQYVPVLINLAFFKEKQCFNLRQYSQSVSKKVS